MRTRHNGRTKERVITFIGQVGEEFTLWWGGMYFGFGEGKFTLGRGISKHKGTEEGDPVDLVSLVSKREGILGVENQAG